ncbi:unnamed protein product [Anisakis simplex]|uniref:Cystatin domain-containing protein n=1 Tax=Anisakis simplex TaxID=6269 RepID=A0A0M3KCU9_ANISI|nr:unnamed protein product [Anisakis simplex]
MLHLFTVCFIVLSAITTVLGVETQGGWKEQNVDSKDVKELTTRAMNSLNLQMNDLYYWIPIKKVSFKNFEAANCAQKEGGDKKIFTVTIWLEPSKNSGQATIISVGDA